MNVNKSINQLFDLLNKLNNRSDLTVKITNLSNELLETLKKIENCTSCKDNIKRQYSYFSRIYESINKMGNYLVEVEKDEKEDMIHKLSGELIEIGVQLNRDVLCRICGGKHMMSRLSNILNELINRNDLTIGITDLSNGLLGTLKKIENCTSCKDNVTIIIIKLMNQ